MKWFLAIYNTIVYFVLFPLMFNDAAVLTIMQVQCVCVCVCVFIKLHITTQSGSVILLAILCHSH